MNLRFLLILLILLGGWPVPAPALSQPVEPPPLILEAGTQQLDLAGHMSYLIDRDGDLGLEGVMARRADGAFTLSTAPEITAGHRPWDAVWVYLRPERASGAPSDWWLEAGEDILDDIQLFEIAPDGTPSTRHGGRALPFAERELAWRKHAFRLTLVDTEPREIYLRYASSSTLRIIPRLFQPWAYDRHRTAEDLFLGAYFGIMSLALLISGFRAIRYRSLLDGYYALYILGLDFTHFINLGMWQQLGLEGSLPLRQFLMGAGLVMATLALTGFIRHLIDWPVAQAKRLDRPLIALGFLYAASYLLVWLVVPALSQAFVNLISLLFILGILVVTLWAAYRGYANARFFLVAFTPFLVAALGRLADAFGLILGVDVVYHLYLLAAAIHAILLMAAILIRDAAQRRSRERLEWQVARLREDIANRALFTRMLAHEVRTPLAIIDSYSQMLGRHPSVNGAGSALVTATTAVGDDRGGDNGQAQGQGQGQGQGQRKGQGQDLGLDQRQGLGEVLDQDLGADPGIMTPVEQIRGGVRRLSAILDRFLRQDRLSTLEQVERIPLDLYHLITRTVAEVQRQSEDHLLSYPSPARSLWITGDPDLLRILLLNLLENAVRYSPEGGAIQVRTACGEGQVTIEVSDEGVGIPVEAQQRIFERYYRTSQVKEAIGAGLGLYIVRSIARLHGGDVTCESTLGEGSTFRVSLRLGGAD